MQTTVNKAARRLTIEQSKDSLLISFKKDFKVINDLKASISSKKFDWEAKKWSIPFSNIEEAIYFIEKWQEVPEWLLSLRSQIQKEREEKEKEFNKNIEASRKKESDIEIPSVKLTPYPFQRAGVEYIINNGNVMLSDQMGLGKTIQAICAVEYQQTFPAIIICPNSLKYNWQNEIRKWTGKEAVIVNSKDTELAISDYYIINYDIVKKQYENLKSLNAKVIIADESQYLKNNKAQRTKTVKELSKDIQQKIFLTGTAIVNRPQELISQLDILGRLNAFGGFWKFATRYCNAHRTRFGLDMSGAKNLDELNTKLRANCYVRREKEDVLKELPAKQRSTIEVDIDNMKEYKRAESDLISYLQDKVEQDREFQESIKELSEEEQKKAVNERKAQKQESAEAAEHLVQINALKKLAAQGKMKEAKQWIDNYIEDGSKLVVFAHHREMVDQLADEYNAPKITGDISAEKRQQYVDQFQNNPNTPVIFLNIKAGGTGLTLTASSTVLFLENDWTPAAHDQAEDRCHRIGQGSSVNCYYMLGKGTIDEDIYDLIQEKRQVTNQVNIGGEAQQNKSIMNELISKMI